MDFSIWIIESLHLLGMARSFRGNSIKTVISHNEPACTVFGLVLRDAQVEIPVGVSRPRQGEAQIKVGGDPIHTLAELAEYLPIQVINAESFDLLTGSPESRRQYLDWGVFHVERGFLIAWRRYQRAIKQRNKLLRHGKMIDEQLAAWTAELVAAGEVVTKLRLAYFERLRPLVQHLAAELSPDLEAVSLSFRQGWDKTLTFDEALSRSLDGDLEQGYTHVGPQRADIRVTVDGHSAADTLSRGQQKIAVCALKLAQGQLLGATRSQRCVYLVDDLPSELDERHSRLVCEILTDLGAQVFITCVEKEDILSVWPGDGLDLGVFHVKQGCVELEKAPLDKK